MIRSEATGLRHSTSSATAVEALDRMQAELLAYGLEAAVVFDAVAADPGFAAAQALAAAMHLFTLSAEGQAKAAGPVARARALAPAANARERALITAIDAWFHGDIEGALARHRRIAADWPEDLVAHRIAQFHFINAGDFQGLRRFTGPLAATTGNRYLLGMHALALAETGALAAAEAAGRRAADAGFDPWAEHAVAHALDRQGRVADGIAFLAPRAPAWRRCSSFLRTHNWWHLALLQLKAGNGSEALRLFDGEVWGVRPESCQDQANAISLLARLELAGVDVGPRWAALAPHLRRRTADQQNGFFDLHVAYGLARAGEDGAVAQLLENLAARGARERGRLWGELLPAAAHAVVAHARAEWGAAARLGALIPDLWRVGGSGVQRDLFRMLHADALARA
jgi:hypothetical protein